MNIGDEYNVIIEKLSNLGLGIARIDNFVVFVENACPADKVKITVTNLKKNYANAKIKEIIESSEHRVSPFCPMQKVCGACQLQFIDYDYQLELKRQITQDALHTIANLNIDIPSPIKSPEIKNYRHKIQYPVSQTKNSKRILAGYYKPHSHEIVNIKYCPIQPEVCDKIINFIRENCSKYNISGYDEKLHCGNLRHVVIRNSAYNASNLVVLVVNDNKIQDKYVKLGQEIFNAFNEIEGVCVNFNTKRTNVILGKTTKTIAGKDYIEEKILDKKFKIGAETFFQVNPQSAENIFKYVKEYISNNFENPTVLDAYAGISAFGICIADIAKNVVCVEENIQSVELAKKCIQENNVDNLELHAQDANEFFKNENRKYDVIILDPPRKGSSEQALDAICKLCADTIIYVSCNPATLARDLKYLTGKGCSVQSVQPFDMFCHTYHVENVAIIKVN